MVTVALGTAVAFNDKLVFQRERADRLYSPASHFVSRLVVGVRSRTRRRTHARAQVPIVCVTAACLILPSYWWIGLKPDGSSFFFFLLTNCALIFLFDGVVGAIVFLANDVTTAFGIGNAYEAVGIFMSGIFIQATVIPKYWIWLFYLSPFNYAFAAVAVNQFAGGENDWWLDTVGITWRDKWGNFFVLLAMGLLWRALGLALSFWPSRQG
jgi:ABC-type multidrug transport system permease subunit